MESNLVNPISARYWSVAGISAPVVAARSAGRSFRGYCGIAGGDCLCRAGRGDSLGRALLEHTAAADLCPVRLITPVDRRSRCGHLCCAGGRGGTACRWQYQPLLATHHSHDPDDGGLVSAGQSLATGDLCRISLPPHLAGAAQRGGVDHHPRAGRQTAGVYLSAERVNSAVCAQRVLPVANSTADPAGEPRLHPGAAAGQTLSSLMVRSSAGDGACRDPGLVVGFGAVPDCADRSPACCLTSSGMAGSIAGPVAGAGGSLV